MAGRGAHEGRRKLAGSGGHEPSVCTRKLRSRGQKSRRWSAGRRRARVTGAARRSPTGEGGWLRGGAFRRSTPSHFREGLAKPGADGRAATNKHVRRNSCETKRRSSVGPRRGLSAEARKREGGHAPIPRAPLALSPRGRGWIARSASRVRGGGTIASKIPLTRLALFVRSAPSPTRGEGTGCVCRARRFNITLESSPPAHPRYACG
jgi:hypothetical protein